ncbi:MAG: DUF4190 domain-containing protein [Planctomycetota bacterium]
MHDTPPIHDEPQEQAQPMDPVAVPASAWSCPHCGINLQGHSIGQACPGCGKTINSLQPGGGQSTSGKATAALVLGICSIVGCLFYGIPGLICGILAVIFAGQVRREIASGQLSPSLLGQANAGRICGWVGLGLSSVWLLLFVVYIVIFVVAIASHPTPSLPPSYPSLWPPVENLAALSGGCTERTS